MKLMIASDLHGSAAYTRRLLELYRDTGCQRLVLLGELLQRGAANFIRHITDTFQLGDSLDNRHD